MSCISISVASAQQVSALLNASFFSSALLIFYMLFSCIPLFSFTENESQPIVASYMEHESLAYGVDWCRLEVNATQDGITRPDANTTLADAVSKCQISTTDGASNIDNRTQGIEDETISGENTDSECKPTNIPREDAVVDRINRTKDNGVTQIQHNSDEIIASCSFYDHSLHIWKFKHDV